MEEESGSVGTRGEPEHRRRNRPESTRENGEGGRVRHPPGRIVCAEEGGAGGQSDRIVALTEVVTALKLIGVG